MESFFSQTFISQWGLPGLFVSALLSSTLLPGGSEALLIVLAIEASHSKTALLLTATFGNVLGGMSSWLLGYYFAHRFSKKQRSNSKHRKAIAMIQRWGSRILLFSWLPVIGDPLCLMAGWIKIHWLPVLIYIFIGKFLRYLFLVSVV